MEQSPQKVDDVGKAIYDSIKIDDLLNKGDELPFALYSPDSNGKVTWHCGYDAAGKITSVFRYEEGTQSDKQCTYLDDKERALFFRETLLQNGWKLVKPPKITFTYPGQKEGAPITRKQKRFLKKKLEQMNRRNPFLDKKEEPSKEDDKQSSP